MSQSRYCLHIALGLTLLLGSVDMSLNMYYFTEGEKYILYFSLVDAVVFTILTIVLVICTIQLFNFLKVLRHTSKKERLLIVVVTFFFTASYGVRCFYLITQAFLDTSDAGCGVQY